MFEWLESHQLPCLFKAIWGIECPGCGFQRALLFLMRGEWLASACTWPALLPLLAFILLAVLKISGVKKITGDLIKNVGFVCLIIILISYLLKLMINIY